MSGSYFSFRQGFFCLVSIGLFGFLGCATFYKPVSVDSGTSEKSIKIITEQTSKKYFILRQGVYNYAMKDIHVDSDSETLMAILTPVDSIHMKYIHASMFHNKFKSTDNLVLQEIHIYSKLSSPPDISKVFSLPLDQIEEIELIEYDQKRMKKQMLTVIGVTVAVGLVAGLIIALSDFDIYNHRVTPDGPKTTSCPYVSVFDGEQYWLQGELYGGAMNHTLERMDFLPLKIRPIDGAFQIRISNELKERQYTDFADLMIIEHSDRVKAGRGTDGKIYQFSNPALPFSANLNGKLDVLPSILHQDLKKCSFDDTSNASGINQLMLEFQKEVGIHSSKLVLQVKNSFWLDMLYREYSSHFGRRYNDWQEAQEKRPAEQLTQWIEDQDMPLTVSIYSDNRWKTVTRLDMIGPLEYRQIIVPLEPDPSGETVKIKLSTGFYFWELDYAGMDFTPEEPVRITTLQPSFAQDENGRDVLSEIKDNDQKYLGQLETGNYAMIKYKCTQSVPPGKAWSVILNTKGYYEPIREFEGSPDRSFLRKFKAPGELALYSLNQYRSVLNHQAGVAASPQ